MIFKKTPLAGLLLIEMEPHADERGIFARLFCMREFQARGLQTSFPQANLSTNKKTGTVRGMHYQNPPHAETKLVRCTHGAIYDVAVDVRKDSPSYLQWFGAELSESNGLMLYVPAGFAHGYQALTDEAAVHYMVSEYYAPGAEAGLNPADPALAIRWPLPIGSMSEKDGNRPHVTLTGN